jgi:hypothetical protein
VPFTTHEAIRVVLKSGTFPLLIDRLVEADEIGPEFWAAYRARRGVTEVAARAVGAAANRGRHQLVILAAEAMLRLGADLPDEDKVFIRRARRAAANALKAAAWRARPGRRAHAMRGQQAGTTAWTRRAAG